MKKVPATYESLKIGDLVCHHYVVGVDKKEDLMIVIDIVDNFHAFCCPQSQSSLCFELSINNLKIVKE